MHVSWYFCVILLHNCLMLIVAELCLSLCFHSMAHCWRNDIGSLRGVLHVYEVFMPPWKRFMCFAVTITAHDDRCCSVLTQLRVYMLISLRRAWPLCMVLGVLVHPLIQQFTVIEWVELRHLGLCPAVLLPNWLLNCKTVVIQLLWGKQCRV